VKPRGGILATATNVGKENPIIICFTYKENSHISKNCLKKGTASNVVEKVLERIITSLQVLTR